ncbi:MULTISPECIES: MarR family winged helix-turn-helix transcriptional regulator [unclassified Anaeromyxobacter]|uniref:MarR family winged helix-turn-helix transcriptional regulator n=1 Tax=unclassified Anaeromyxobacter TaxID=2620896 RepID=UPI001F565E39|nr:MULTISPECIES: MarR family transcriptional regulator [unclassified Anaeromyxobacter]
MTARSSIDASSAAAEATRCVALRARRLSRLVTSVFEEALRGHPITVAQFTLLGATILEGPLRPARLARMLDLEKSTLSRNLRLLEAAGLVRIAGLDSGGQRIEATERGRRALVEALPDWRAAQERAVAALGDAVVARLDGMIAALGGERAPEGRGRGGRLQARASKARL